MKSPSCPERENYCTPRRRRRHRNRPVRSCPYWPACSAPGLKRPPRPPPTRATWNCAGSRWRHSGSRRWRAGARLAWRWSVESSAAVGTTPSPRCPSPSSSRKKRSRATCSVAVRGWRPRAFCCSGSIVVDDDDDDDERRPKRDDVDGRTWDLKIENAFTIGGSLSFELSEDANEGDGGASIVRRRIRYRNGPALPPSRLIPIDSPDIRAILGKLNFPNNVGACNS